MKIPKRHLDGWAKELVDECSVDREERMSRYRRWSSIYYTGSDNDVPSKHNRCYSHVDKLSSFLFSPSEVRFNVEFDEVNEKEWEGRASAASNYLNRQFSRRNCDVVFGQANEWSLVKGACLTKLVWGRGGFEPWLIQPEFFGVLRPDIEDLERQDAFCHTFFLTQTQFRRMLGDRSDRTAIMGQVEASFRANEFDEMSQGGVDLMTGGGFPFAAIQVPGVTAPGTPQSQGTVDWTGAQPGPVLAPDVRARLVRIDDLWVWDDDREDWTTIRYVDPGLIIEGRDMHRNLSDAPHDQPFVRVCSNLTPNYFWGRSEIQNIWPNQRMLTARLNNIDSIFNLQAKPARSVIGGSGITDEKVRALLTPGGVLTDSNPTAKIETYKPEMPQGALEYLQYLDTCFDEAAGFTPILQGQGETGVRAGVHAGTLLKTSSPRLRDRALIVEKQAAEWGDLCLKMLRAKDASVIRTPEGEELVLDQLPPDASVVVDSHTSSPAFSGDNQQLSFALAKAGAMDPVSLIEAVHPPMEEKLIARQRSSQKERSAMMEELKKVDPEQWAKAVGGGGRRR